MHAKNIPKLFFLVSVQNVPIADIPKKRYLGERTSPPLEYRPQEGDYARPPSPGRSTTQLSNSYFCLNKKTTGGKKAEYFLYLGSLTEAKQTHSEHLVKKVAFVATKRIFGNFSHSIKFDNIFIND